MLGVSGCIGGFWGIGPEVSISLVLVVFTSQFFFLQSLLCLALHLLCSLDGTEIFPDVENLDFQKT